jgi:solute carrier family 50 protein (sugar transporter)
MSALKDVLFGTVLPSIGNVINIVLFMSSLSTMQNIKLTNSVESVNCVPFLMQGAQCLLWLFYGILISNYQIALPNVLGAALGFYYTATFLSYSTDVYSKSKFSTVLAIVVFGPLAFYTACVFAFNEPQANLRNFVFGVVSNIVTIMWYYSPLSTIRSVISQKDASSISWSLSLCMLTSSTIWVIYGLYLQNYFVYTPNSLGVIFTSAQICLKAIYRSKKGVIAAELSSISDGPSIDQIPLPASGKILSPDSGKFRSPYPQDNVKFNFDAKRQPQ